MRLAEGSRRVYNLRNAASNIEASTTTAPIECAHAPDVSYFITLEGVLKSLAVALNFLCFLCICVGGYHLGVGFPIFVSVVGFSISLIFLVLYIFYMTEDFGAIVLTELVYCFAWTIFHFISGSLLGVAAASHESGALSWAMACFFSLSVMCVYGLDCYLKFSVWRKEDKIVTSSVE